MKRLQRSVVFVDRNERSMLSCQGVSSLTNEVSGKNLLSEHGTSSSAKQAAVLRSAVDRAELCRWTALLLPGLLLPLLLCRVFAVVGVALANAALLLLPLPAFPNTSIYRRLKLITVIPV